MKSRNYIVLIVFYFFTVLCVLYLCQIYSNSKSVGNFYVDYYVIVITDSYFDKMVNNVLNFASEHDQFVIYVSSHRYDGFDSFEERFISVVGKDGLRNRVLFIDSDNLSSYDYVNKLIDRLDGVVSISRRDLPIFIIVKNQKVSSIEFVGGFDEQSLETILGGIYD